MLKWIAFPVLLIFWKFRKQHGENVEKVLRLEVLHPPSMLFTLTLVFSSIILHLVTVFTETRWLSIAKGAEAQRYEFINRTLLFTHCNDVFSPYLPEKDSKTIRIVLYKPELWKVLLSQHKIENYQGIKLQMFALHLEAFSIPSFYPMLHMIATYIPLDPVKDHFLTFFSRRTNFEPKNTKTLEK